MDLTQDLQNVLGEHLPQMQVDYIKNRLEEADRLERKVESLQADARDLAEELSEHRQRDQRQQNKIAELETMVDMDLDYRERSVRISHAEEIVLLREEHAMNLGAELKDVVSLVFQNNKYKHHRAVPIDGGGVAVDQHGCPQHGMQGHVEMVDEVTEG